MDHRPDARPNDLTARLLGLGDFVVQQDTLGHGGYRDDPLYKVRRLLRRGLEHLTDDQLATVDAALQAGDPDWEVTIA